MQEPLYIPKSKRWKGLTTYCRKCRKTASEICHDTGKHLSTCKAGDRHSLRLVVYIPGKDNIRKTVTLKAKTVEEGIKEAIDIQESLKSGITETQPKAEPKKEVENKPYLLTESLARFVGTLHGENIAPHLFKKRSPEHIKDMSRGLFLLPKFLKEEKIDLKKFTVENFNDDIVGMIHSKMDEMEYSGRNHNKVFGYYKQFLKWYDEEINPTRNWFARGQNRPDSPPPIETLTFEEYLLFKENCTPEKGWKRYENGVKPNRQLYRPYLMPFIELALYTGRRRQEVAEMKFNHIETDKDGYQVIKVADAKVNNMQKRELESEKKFAFVPVIPSLKKVLDELGLQEKIGRDEYIIAPEIQIQRNRILSDTITKGFTQIFDQLGTGKAKTLKACRKTYITELEIYMGNPKNITAITGHTTRAILDDRYINKRPVAFAVAQSGFDVFGKERERKNELDKIRSKTSEKSPEQNIEL